MVKKKLHHGEVRGNTTVAVPLHRGEISTAPWCFFRFHRGETFSSTMAISPQGKIREREVRKNFRARRTPWPEARFSKTKP